MKRFLILINIVLMMLTIFVISIQAEEAQIITGITVEGNQTVATEEILGLVKSIVGDLLDEEQLKADLKSIYDLGYFQDAKISFETYNGGLKTIFELIEYPVIKDIVIEGSTSYNDEKLLELLGVETGKILNHNKLVEGRKKIEELYFEDSYILASFTDINVSDEGILTLKIDEGYLNEIIIKGNDKTKDFVIKRELNFKPGEPINKNKIQKSMQNILKTRFFQDINPRLQRVEGSNKANLIIEVTEAKTRKIKGGVTWSSKDGWIGSTELNLRNFMGKGQTVGLDWEFGGVNNYSISFYEPWVFGNPTSFGISLYDKTSHGEDSVKGKYDEHRSGGSISLGHALTEEWDGKVRFKIEKSDLDWKEDRYIDDEVTYDLTDETTEVRSLTFQTSRDTTNHPFYPTKGGIDIFSIEYAGQILGGNTDFTKYNFDLRRYYPGFKGEQAWAFRLKSGLSDGELPSAEKYKLGGSETLRGYDYGIFSGNDMLLMNAEYRFPIADNFTGVIFADAGDAWESRDEINLGKLHYSLGAGLRMNTPIGQIRLDYGFNEDGEGQPHFSLGQTF